MHTARGNVNHSPVRGDTMKREFTRWIVAVALPLLAAAPAGALIMETTPAVSIAITIDGAAVVQPVSITTTPSLTVQGAFESGSNSIEVGADLIQVVLCVKPDPFITSSFTITNSSSATQTFSFLSTLPVSPAIPSPTVMNGHISGTVTDANSSGSALVSTNGSAPLYQGWIDGGVVGTTALYSDPSSWGTGTIPYVSFASLPGGAVASAIGIQINFTLSAGDSVTLDSFFEVLPVPEPASAGLVAIASAGLALLHRRRA